MTQEDYFDYDIGHKHGGEVRLILPKKNMEISSKDIVGEVVADNYKAASVFKKNGIDFCCRGNRTIEEVCEQNELNLNELLNELNDSMDQSISGEIDYKSWPLDQLADHIEKKHHAYVENKILEIRPYLDKVVQVHGDHYPELYEIKLHFEASSDELTMHMKKEELIIFPFIRKLLKAKKENATITMSHFDTIENPIEQMRQDHDEEGVRFRKIAALSDNYTPPVDACNTYRVTYALLREFENDLHLHIHLENNILFPGAIDLEKYLIDKI